MSNGDMTPPANPMREMTFDGPTLHGVLAPELAAVQDAQGDVRGAHQHLAEEIRVAQRAVETAETRLSERQAAMQKRVSDLELIGRLITIHEGQSAGERRPVLRGAGMYTLPTRKNLEGVTGTIVGTEIGTKTGQATNGSDELVLHVNVQGSLIPPRAFRRYMVRTDETIFSIGEVPETGADL